MLTTYQLVQPKKAAASDPLHVYAGMSRTFCGRDATEWLEIEKREKSAILNDTSCCSRCAAGLRNRDGGFQ